MGNSYEQYYATNRKTRHQNYNRPQHYDIYECDDRCDDSKESCSDDSEHQKDHYIKNRPKSHTCTRHTCEDYNHKKEKPVPILKNTRGVAPPTQPYIPCKSKPSSRGPSSQEQIEKLRNILRIRLQSAKLDNSLAEDIHTKLQHRLRRTTDVLETLIIYIESIILQENSMNQFCSGLNQLFCTEELFESSTVLYNLLKELCSDSQNMGSLIEIKKSLREIELSRNTQELIEEYCQRKSDFELASKNFSFLLEESQLSLGQLEKLQKQFEKIFVGFQHSRVLVDQHIPMLIRKRLRLLSDCSEALCSVIRRHSGFCLKMEIIFKNIRSKKSNECCRKTPRPQPRHCLTSSLLPFNDNEKCYTSC